MYPKSHVSSVRVNPQLQELLEGTKQLHHMSLSDALEEGILLVLSKIMPVSIIENQIEETRNRLVELETALNYAKKVEAESIKLLEKKDPAIAFESAREELFKEGPGTLMNQLKRNQNPAWDRVYMRYGFGTAKEMEIFVRREAIERGII